MRGLKTKLLDLYSASLFLDHSCICLSETWINDNIHNNELFCDDFLIYRCDRSTINSNKSSGGGVLIAVNRNYPSFEISLKHSSVEMVCTKLRINHNWIYILNVYIPPDALTETYNKFFLNIKAIIDHADLNDKILIVGDFNLPDIFWINSEDECFNFMAPTNISTEKSVTFFDNMNLLPLFQVNSVKNYMRRMLDLVYTDSPNDLILTNSEDPILKVDMYHPPLEIHLSVPDLSTNNYKKVAKHFNFKRTDFSSMNLFFHNNNWSSVKSCRNLDEALNEFYSILSDAITRYVPYKNISANKTKSWITPRLKRLKNKKNTLYKKFKKTFNENIRIQYNIIKRQIHFEKKLAYDNYICNLKTSFKTNPNKFWDYINAKRNIDNYPKIMEYNDETCDNDEKICELFAKFFKTVYKSDDKNTCPDLELIPINNTYNFVPPVIQHCDIYSAINKAKCCFSSGPDNVPSCIFKKCSESLVDVLCYLFNFSLKSGVFPSVWKSSFIVPLFKKGARHDITNYRGIAKLSAMPKLFEAVLTTDLTFKVKSIITPHQHGFCLGKSTLTNLLTLSTTVSEGFASKLQTDVGYFDFSKAFDQLNHRILFKKLSRLGFSDNYLQWITQYLTGRTQCVSFNGCFSSIINVSSGVPQGSHLGPLLFVLFINDLPKAMSSSNILLFADDAKIFKSLNSIKDCYDLQADFNNLSTWCNNNDLCINISKCNILTFCRKRNSIEFEYVLNNLVIKRVSNFCDLGVNFDSKMCFNQHIDIIKARASSRLGMIKRWSKEFNDPHITKLLYVGLVRSILEYNSSVWCPYYESHISALESVQRQFLLFALKSLNWENRYILPKYEHRLLLLDLNTLEHRRIIQNILLMAKIIEGEINCPYLLSATEIRCPTRRLRNYTLVNMKTFNLNYLNYEPFNLMKTQFNKYYDQFDFNLSFKKCKDKLAEYFKRLMLN